MYPPNCLAEKARPPFLVCVKSIYSDEISQIPGIKRDVGQKRMLFKSTEKFYPDIKYISAEIKSCGLFFHNFNSTTEVYYAKSISHPLFLSHSLSLLIAFGRSGLGFRSESIKMVPCYAKILSSNY